MAHKLEKKWKNEIRGKKNVLLRDKNPDFWKPLRKMKDFLIARKHFLKENKKTFLPKNKK
ncbi:hypothetical protein ACFLZ7_03785 [Nanoarchaeota archaeon]